jgi:hypothetical protein
MLVHSHCARFPGSTGDPTPNSLETDRKKEHLMGLLEEAAGAFAAVEGAKKLDPNAGIFTEGVAAIAGFEGTKEITNFIEKKEDEKSEPQS